MEKSSSEKSTGATIIHKYKATAAAALRKRHLLRCCSCVGAFLFFVAILALTLILTVFKIRGPVIRLNGSTVKLELLNGTTLPRPGSNATINADVSVRNRNFVSFRHPIATSTVYYRGVAIGDAVMPAGNLPARRTTRMNVTVNIEMDRVVKQREFGSDFGSGLVEISLYTRVGGRAKFLLIKKHLTLKMNCTATVNVSTLTLAQCKCKPKQKLFN